MVLVESWLTSSVEDRESFSSRDDMGCMKHSSICSTEIDDLLYLGRFSQGISRVSYRETSQLSFMMCITGWLWSQCKGNWPNVNLILHTLMYFVLLG